MAQVQITGWRPGFQKIAAIQLLVESTSYGLKKSKDCVDDVLGGGQATIELKDKADAERLAARLEKVGAVVTVKP
ncbi:MAG: ribosomal protein L7/L12 [Pyrinomonadaceae bacterium]|nr:ribosomal protein L7/L12 [Pyrinomonadaceae bacterium]MDQ3585008.1 ribosomal protein L7/L12 [Acidobacteriota bacterium]